jgi:hypothetical protein
MIQLTTGILFAMALMIAGPPITQAGEQTASDGF